MSLIIETGAGVRNANSYVDTAYVSSYLADRNRSTENSWDSATSAVQEAAIIAATDYLEKRYGGKFLGLPKVTFLTEYAEALLSFSGLPVSAEELVIGDETYKFVSTLSGDPFEILIGTSATATAAAVEAALNSSDGAGTLYGSETPQSRHVSAVAAAGVVTLTANAPGPSGALTALSGTVTNLSITAFSGGRDGGLQPLSWPRTRAYDQQGNEIVGIPNVLKQAICEYAVRAVAASLLSDPSTDSYAGKISERTETVGPITESVKYEAGSMGSVVFSPYPAADKLLRPILQASGGGVIRG